MLFTLHVFKEKNVYGRDMNTYSLKVMSIGFSVYFDSQSDVEPHSSKYGQSTSNTHIIKKASEMQILRPHPRPIEGNLYFNKISGDLYAQEDLRSANVEECFLIHLTINNPWKQTEIL